MKNKLTILIMSICALMCCSFVLSACGDNVDPQIKAVYNSYVTYTQNNGGTPLSYDEWLNSIKGEKGDKGDTGVGVEDIKIDDGKLYIKYTNSDYILLGTVKGDKGNNGLSAYELYKKYHSDYTKTEQEFLNDLINFKLGEDENPQGLDFYLLDNGTYSVTVGKAKELSNIVIPETYKGKKITKISNEGFKDCKTLKTIIIPNNVESIGKEAFYNCMSLQSITIPDSIESIGRDAFYNCPIENATMPTLAISYISKTNFKTIIITSGEGIGFNTFSECEYLQSVVIENNVTTIGDNAFSDCKSLQSIVIGNSVESIGAYAFKKCTSLTNVTYNGTIEQWNAIDKGFNWKDLASFNVIHCSDGNVNA